ncbi:MAG: nicotinate-nucleotide--dimethylbenzimidazole phosphoribosyltransferase [Dethiobacter sp.]|jgi:nicotinate-nucleotide--dimethylbenzimidazole phosphoribosyltransferase|nr:nicotinate-nucleotide--dimethylbenzimidazole phosphoribosyltransferase [Dethiobacter sp.]MBS3900016.1 nicotinate-nucleotide--dimethylbenzimidazole phosphoribosyltransferase [Dethiobacter sp.]MBS3982986.1 nicotinate-nucleotide--dimethylbenzimidazole phosphoribosyltransferase [Dethiobacter sp.]MCL4464116.1 nicotinate-nucleotide--dimethylbenzimidazole phosphoribosyltransferase [Bacillota bacterium]MCL5993758.1 nicotinate-nucleotide--dimethylbenzimidazole phosphoribosyltransferase [Bacillota bac
MEKLIEILSKIKPVDQEAGLRCKQHLDNLTKPPGSLGVLEEIAQKLATITGEIKPLLPKKTVVLMAGDHGVVAEGVSAYPQEVTPQMVMNFLSGGAAMNVLARHANAELVVVDVGVAVDLPSHPCLQIRKIAYGTNNLAKGPAMTRRQTVAALECGINVAEECIANGTGIFGTGEMGIGNTTSSAAITAVYSGGDIAAVCGRGTGLDDGKLQNKVRVIRDAISLNDPESTDALDVLSKLGGYEIAGMAGVMLAAAAHNIPVLVDGFISGAAALIAGKLHPNANQYMLASHLSEEPGHAVTLQILGLSPFLKMNMRLGEGTGSALAMTMVDAAIKICAEMASFADAGVAKAIE